MVRLIPFEELFCMLGSSHDIVADSCRNQDDFLNYIETSRWRSFRRKTFNCLNCEEACYPVYYWVLLVFSLYGSVQSICAFFYQTYKGATETASTWFNNKFHALPLLILIRMRVLARFIAANCWVLLLYGVIYVSPSYMKLWIVVHVVVFTFRLIKHILEAIIGRLRKNFLIILVSKAVDLFLIAVVFQAMVTFHAALKMNSREKLMLSNQYINLL